MWQYRNDAENDHITEINYMIFNNISQYYYIHAFTAFLIKWMEPWWAYETCKKILPTQIFKL